MVCKMACILLQTSQIFLSKGAGERDPELLLIRGGGEPLSQQLADGLNPSILAHRHIVRSLGLAIPAQRKLD